MGTGEEILPQRGGAVWEISDHRAVVEAILWKLGTGARWDDLGMPTGSHITISSWYYEWDKNGLWQKSHDVPRYVGITTSA